MRALVQGGGPLAARDSIIRVCCPAAARNGPAATPSTRAADNSRGRSEAGSLLLDHSGGHLDDVCAGMRWRGWWELACGLLDPGAMGGTGAQQQQEESGVGWGTKTSVHLLHQFNEKRHYMKSTKL